MDTSDGGVKSQVVGVQVRSLSVKVELEVDAGAEDEAVGRAAEVEHAQLVTLVYILAWRHGDFATRDFCHPNGYDTHQSNAGIVRLDKDQRSGGH